MAGPTKRSKKPAKPQSAENYESDDSDSYHGEQEIQVDFEGRNPEGQDFHGIKQLLHQLFLNAHIDTSQMADMLIAQTGVGSVLKQSYSESDDEEDVDMSATSEVFGVTSVINLTSHKESPCIQQLIKLIEEHSQTADQTTQTTFKQILNQTGRVGFILNERFINIPCKVSEYMLGMLYEEIGRIQKKQNDYKFDYFLMVSKTWKEKGDEGGETIFANSEEQLFMNQADCSFEFSVADSSDTGLTGNWGSEDKELIPYRTVFLFKADKLEGIINAVKVFVQV